MKRWKKYAEILEKDYQIFLKRSSLLSASRFGQSATVTPKDEIAGENWDKLSKAERYQFLKRTFVL
ncbi:hypothetical protein A1D21_01200 [Aerococcus loyolae]|nr:hypothetical protein A1D21_01200 [Aerococcus loyolae]